MKSFLSICLLVFLVSCSSAQKRPEPQVSGQGETSVQLETKVTIQYLLQNFSQADAKRMQHLFEVAQKVINSEKFKKRVFGAYYDKKLQFVQNNGLSNEEIYQKIIEGSELGGPIDNIWQMDVTYERGSRGVLGWTYPTTTRIWFNSRYFKNRADSGIVGTICHEQMHKLGFGHDYKSTARRPYSVPYSVGTVCAEIAKEYL